MGRTRANSASRRTRGRRFFVAVVVATIVTVTAGGVPAADTVAELDARDPKGDALGTRALDIADVSHSQRGAVLFFDLTTYDAWMPRLLDRGGRISFSFDTDADAQPERVVDIRSAGGMLSAVVLGANGRRVGRGHATRRDVRSVTVEFESRLLGSGVRRYRWFVATGVRCHDDRPCGDTFPRRGTLVSSRLVPPPRPPAPLAGKGYRLVFADEFQSLDPVVWTRSVWWEPPAAAGDIYTRNGVLHLVSRRTSGFKTVSITSLDPYRPQPVRSFRRGYFEARMRWTKGNGAWPAFWLSSRAQAYGRTSATLLNGELDVFEGQGSEPDVFYGTLHKNTNGNFGVPDETNNGFNRVAVDLTAGFHTYAALWTETFVSWYLDGVELARTPAYESTDQEMLLIFQMWIGGWTRGTDASTPDELHTEVDWVRVWQR
jgi:hypothetical protein